MSQVITLTTDMGYADGYVGAMKGVILEFNPEATIVDIAHDVPPGDVAHGAVVLATAAPYFPQGSVHVAVVDPGVGSAARRAIAMESAGQYFVGPDNGLFSLLCSGDCKAVELSSEGARLRVVSTTFHGRDIFSPAAARLSLGFPLNGLGPDVHDPVLLDLLAVKDSPGELRGSVMHVDRFGNLITNLKPLLLKGRSVVRVRVGDLEVRGIRQTYSEVSPGEPLALWGSLGYLELGVNRGRADELARARRGTPVVLTLKS
jgi:S-adenosylmethionine hydrolase